MAEYISREAVNYLIEDMQNNRFILMCEIFNLALLKSKVAEIPAADVQPVKWISVNDRLPKCIRGSSDSVLVHRDNGECEVAYLVYDDDDGFYWYTQDGRTAFEFEQVTHWQSLPQPPQD